MVISFMSIRFLDGHKHMEIWNLYSWWTGFPTDFLSFSLRRKEEQGDSEFLGRHIESNIIVLSQLHSTFWLKMHWFVLGAPNLDFMGFLLSGYERLTAWSIHLTWMVSSRARKELHWYQVQTLSSKQLKDCEMQLSCKEFIMSSLSKEWVLLTW